MDEAAGGAAGNVVRSAAAVVRVEPHWLGAKVTAERGRAGAEDNLRMMMIGAQQQVANELMGAWESPAPLHLSIWWEIAGADDPDAASVAWNPQVGVPADAGLLICRGELRER